MKTLYQLHEPLAGSARDGNIHVVRVDDTLDMNAVFVLKWQTFCVRLRNTKSGLDGRETSQDRPDASL